MYIANYITVVWLASRYTYTKDANIVDICISSHMLFEFVIRLTCHANNKNNLNGNKDNNYRSIIRSYCNTRH